MEGRARLCTPLPVHTQDQDTASTIPRVCSASDMSAPHTCVVLYSYSFQSRTRLVALWEVSQLWDKPVSRQVLFLCCYSGNSRSPGLVQEQIPDPPVPPVPLTPGTQELLFKGLKPRLPRASHSPCEVSPSWKHRHRVLTLGQPERCHHSCSTGSSTGWRGPKRKTGHLGPDLN